MPSPFGHALAGAAIGFIVDRPAAPGVPRHHPWLFPVLGAVVAALPDADLLLSGVHRTFTHSLPTSAALTILTAAVTGQVTGKIWWRLTLLIGAAHASHPLLDWLGADPYPPIGLQVLWPFDRHYYVSGWNVFPSTERRLLRPDAFAINFRAFRVEAALMTPIALLAWWTTRTRRSRGRSFFPDSRRPPSA